jgi:hypothetical protein
LQEFDSKFDLSDSNSCITDSHQKRLAPLVVGLSTFLAGVSLGAAFGAALGAS